MQYWTFKRTSMWQYNSRMCPSENCNQMRARILSLNNWTQSKTLLKSNLKRVAITIQLLSFKIRVFRRLLKMQRHWSRKNQRWPDTWISMEMRCALQPLQSRTNSVWQTTWWTCGWCSPKKPQFSQWRPLLPFWHPIRDSMWLNSEGRWTCLTPLTQSLTHLSCNNRWRNTLITIKILPQQTWK